MMLQLEQFWVVKCLFSASHVQSPRARSTDTGGLPGEWCQACEGGAVGNKASSGSGGTGREAAQVSGKLSCKICFKSVHPVSVALLLVVVAA